MFTTTPFVDGDTEGSVAGVLFLKLNRWGFLASGEAATRVRLALAAQKWLTPVI
jgi:hypothetical protein